MPNLMSKRADPYGRYNFYVEWNGIIHAGFSQCSGLETIQEPGLYREGVGDSLGMRKLPGLVSSTPITLQRGVTHNDELWKWRKELMTGNADRREVSIVLLDDAGAEKIRWNLTNCWPCRWVGPELDSMQDDIAIETLELTHEGIVKYEVKT